MTNTKKLRQLILYSGIKYTVLSYKLGMSRTTLWSRLNGKSEFTSDEIKDISSVLRLTPSEQKELFG